MSTPAHWHFEIAYVLLKTAPTADDEEQGPRSLSLVDMEFYDDDVLLIVLREVADNGKFELERVVCSGRWYMHDTSIFVI